MSQINPRYWEGELGRWPYKGAPILVAKEDGKFQRPVFKKSGGCRIYALWDEEDLKDFNTLLQEVADGLKMISEKQLQWVQEHNSWKAIVIWVEPYYDTPKGVRDEASLQDFTKSK